MAFGRPDPNAGPYQAWATRLEQWAHDPSTSLDGLPTLTEETFGTATYLRLVERANDALSAFMDGWSKQLAASFARARNLHELAAEMVHLRHLLEPRLRLAEHPAWPDPVRQGLVEGLRTDLASLQAEIEQIVARTSARGRWDRAAADEQVAVVRRNPLTALMAPPVPDPVLGASSASVSVPPPPRAARRIIF